MANRTAKTRRTKPEKPYAEFPLTPHPTGRWCKRFRGKAYYFSGTWQEALAQFQRDWPFITQGRTPPGVGQDDTGCSLRVLCNAFLKAKRQRMDAGELSPRTLKDYRRATDLLIEHFGREVRVEHLGPHDFETLRSKLAARYSPVGLKNIINHCRVVFKFAADQELIPQPVRFGQSFARPSAKTLRKHAKEGGKKIFTAEEIRQCLHAADPILHAMILLGINCGFGNTDCASLPQTVIDWETGWLDFPRPKTEIDRRVKLWPETLAALRAAIEIRPKARDRDDADLCFLTKQGQRWARVQESQKNPGQFITLDPLGQRFTKLLKQLGINGRRGLGFYTLRRMFETIGGEAKDQVAVDAIMGHVDPSMAGTYRQGISDARLEAVTDTIHAWLFSAEAPET